MQSGEAWMVGVSARQIIAYGKSATGTGGCAVMVKNGRIAVADVLCQLITQGVTRI